MNELRKKIVLRTWKVPWLFAIDINDRYDFVYVFMLLSFQMVV